MTTKDQINQQIKIRMDVLEEILQTNQHLIDQHFAGHVLDACFTLYSAMEEDDKDFLDHASFAIEHKKQWGPIEKNS